SRRWPRRPEESRPGKMKPGRFLLDAERLLRHGSVAGMQAKRAFSGMLESRSCERSMCASTLPVTPILPGRRGQGYGATLVLDSAVVWSFCGAGRPSRCRRDRAGAVLGRRCLWRETRRADRGWRPHRAFSHHLLSRSRVLAAAARLTFAAKTRKRRA